MQKRSPGTQSDRSPNYSFKHLHTLQISVLSSDRYCVSFTYLIVQNVASTIRTGCCMALRSVVLSRRRFILFQKIPSQWQYLYFRMFCKFVENKKCLVLYKLTRHMGESSSSLKLYFIFLLVELQTLPSLHVDVKDYNNSKSYQQQCA